jgi:diguanylate cyclase (GGDEF)-like protein/PAS domain S-box-containing protein
MPAAGILHATDQEALVEFLYLAPVGLIKFQPDGRIAMANPKAVQLLMPLRGDPALSDLYRVVADIAPDLQTRVAAFQAPAGQICDQMQLPVKDTRIVLTLGIYKIRPDTLMAVVQDITRAIEQETRIRDDQQRFRAIFENVRDYAIYMVGLDGCLEEWNRSLHRLGGWQATDVVGAPFSTFFPAGDASATALLHRASRHGTAEFEGWGVRRDGTRFWGSTVATALPDTEGNPSGYVLVTRDLTERKRMEDRLVVLATTDPLTGATNRRAGETCLKESFGAWQRYGKDFAVLMVDIDHFKAVNDRFGHDVGDEVLVAAVHCARSVLREADIVVRWGGEEFLMVLPDTGRDIAAMVAERLRRAIADLRIEGYAQAGGIGATVSIGIGVPHPADAAAADVVHRADGALYQAKRNGRDRVVIGATVAD